MESKSFLVLALVAAYALTATALTCGEIKEIVDVQNELRLLVARGQLANQPRAINMQMTVWNDTLAELAQDWADNKASGHAPGISVIGDKRYLLGENMVNPNERVNWTSATMGWFNEHKIYTFSLETPDNGDKIGHYTTMINADARQIGCGAGPPNAQGEIKVVCNYGPTISDADGPYKRAPNENTKDCYNLCCGTTDCPKDIKKYGKKC